MGVGDDDSWWRELLDWLAIPALIAVLLFFGGLDAPAAFRALTGGGAPGTFTVEQIQTIRMNRHVYGDWVAGDGGGRRSGIELLDAGDILEVGDTVKAVDTGARAGVFSAARIGTGAIMPVVLGIMAGFLALIWLVVGPILHVWMWLWEKADDVRDWWEERHDRDW